jgi:ribonuclease BN (tRNA processing enzyme)
VKLTVVGSSPAWPNPGSAHSGYLVEGPGHVLLDCGPGVLPRLRERDGWPNVEAIVITHFHLDHWGDLVPWVWGTMYGLGRDAPRPELWLLPGGRDHLASLGRRLGFPDMFEQAFDVHEYRDGIAFTVGGLSVTPLRLPHYTLETYGLRVSNERSTLAYSGDAGPSDRLVELARDADLFLCEATLERGDLDSEPRGHLSADEAVATFRQARAKRLLLTHRPKELEVPDGVELAYDGQTLEI